MEILNPLLIAILSYKTKLIDDRESTNFERFKNYLRRHPNGRSDLDLGEFDEWLGKDILYQLMGEYEIAIKQNDEGRKQAILDYYKDFDDNRRSRQILLCFILINVFLLFLIGKIGPTRLYLAYLISFISLIVCCLPPVSNIFNNRIVNVINSSKSKRIYKNSEKKIKLEIAYIKLRGNVIRFKEFLSVWIPAFAGMTKNRKGKI